MKQYIIKRKLYALLVDGGGKSISLFKKEYDSLGGQAKLGKSFKEWYRGGAPNTVEVGGSFVSQGASGSAIYNTNQNITNAQNARQAERLANINNASGVANAAKRARNQGYISGKNSVGIVGGIKNTWNRAGTLGKVGMSAAGLAAAGTMAYGLGSMIGEKKK
jgi:hypothetical protein